MEVKRHVTEKSQSSFAEAYRALNESQRMAVDAIEGPVMVIAGPGTGKTQILALRIANILTQTDTAPSSIVALTFTEAGVASMRARLVSLIGSRGYQVKIHTFHGFCNTLIKRYPERFPRIIGGEQILELDALKILESILDTETWEFLRPVNHPYYYVREIKSAISELKREHIDPDSLRVRVADEEREIMGKADLYHAKGAHQGKMKGVYGEALERLRKARECAHVYERYEQELAAARRYDFEDTILEVVRMLEDDADLKLMVQEEHHYILADEHQDANGAQNQLLELLSDFHASPNLFIVGDEKQAIYRFQGASLENFLFFRTRYPDAVCIELKSNYRSTQIILDAAHEVIMPTKGHDSIGRPRLEAAVRDQGLPISVRVAPTEMVELRDVACSIRTLIEEGVSPSEIAVLTRRNADISIVARALRAEGISVSSLQDEQVLAMPLVRACVDLFRALGHFGDDSALYPLLCAPFVKISNLDLYRLTERREGQASLYALLASRDALVRCGMNDPDACHDFFIALDESATFARDACLLDAVDYALERMGVVRYVIGTKDMHGALAALDVFVRYIAHIGAAHPQFGFRELVKALDDANAYGISLFASPPERQSAVRVLTVHRAKGLEYDHVYVPFMHDGRWGSSRGRQRLALPLGPSDLNEEHKEDDERRLLYVAMTRARISLSCSYSETNDEGRSQVPSRFLASLPDSLYTTAEVATDDYLPTSTIAPPHRLCKQDELDYIRTRLEAQGMSVSALNNYVESPWKYFFQSLLRIPSRREPHQLFGSAIDAAFKYMTRLEQGGAFEEALVYAEFERILSALPLSSADREAYRMRGMNSLRSYMGAHTRDSTAVDAGISLAVPFSTGHVRLPELTLRGEYDRIEYVDAETIRVIDFKTGSPKSRAVIEGRTKEGGGNYKRQLIFYALLAAIDPLRRWRVVEGVIDFVEPDEKGRCRREIFPIDEREIEALKQKICSVIEEIISGRMLQSPCDEQSWSREGCDLVARYVQRFL